MALDGGRIPAWRRLGLALRTEDQSRTTVPPSHFSHGDAQNTAACDAGIPSHGDIQSIVEPTENGKSSRLGKRRHQFEPAEDNDQTQKKNKTSRKETNPNGTAETAAPIVTSADNANMTTNPGSTSTSDTPRPKGDPNYRKKKAKPPRRMEEGHVTSSAKERRKGKAHLSPDESPTPNGRPTLLASTETDDLASVATPQKHLKKHKSITKNTSGTSLVIDRRKSVAFTPDTKTTDGNSGQELFKKWVADLKTAGADSTPPEVSNFNLQALIAEEDKAARRIEQQAYEQEWERERLRQTEETNTTSPDKSEKIRSPGPGVATEVVEPASPQDKGLSTPTANTAKGKKKDPLIYIAYLSKYHTDRDNWKFNKAKQNDVVDNALNIFRIPDEHSDALIEYVAGLKGAGVIDRLSERCTATLKDLDEQDKQNPMDDFEARKVAQAEAMQERIGKERKRRETEGDVEALMDHPHSDGYIRRLKRSRAKALLAALGRTAPIIPAHAHTRANGINPLMKSVVPPKRDSRKRKRRGEASSDESSSDSSDDDHSEAQRPSTSDRSSDGEESDSGSNESDRASGSESSSDSSSGQGSSDDSDCD